MTSPDVHAPPWTDDLRQRVDELIDEPVGAPPGAVGVSLLVVRS